MAGLNPKGTLSSSRLWQRQSSSRYVCLISSTKLGQLNCCQMRNIIETSQTETLDGTVVSFTKKHTFADIAQFSDCVSNLKQCKPSCNNIQFYRTQNLDLHKSMSITQKMGFSESELTLPKQIFFSFRTASHQSLEIFLYCAIKTNILCKP